jgi:hypothetical protein
MTLTALRQIYKDANSYRQKFSTDTQSVAHVLAGTVMELCLEIERLQMIADERNSEYSDYTLMPFGKYKCKRLKDVPNDYLEWWSKQGENDRDLLTLEWHHGTFKDRAIASMKIKLLDYIKHREEQSEVS